MIVEPRLRQAIIADGCIISDAHIERSVIGVRSIIESGATIRNSIVMGADYYETEPTSERYRLPPIGIGRNCVIDRAIIECTTRIDVFAWQGRCRGRFIIFADNGGVYFTATHGQPASRQNRDGNY